LGLVQIPKKSGGEKARDQTVLSKEKNHSMIIETIAQRLSETKPEQLKASKTIPKRAGTAAPQRKEAKKFLPEKKYKGDRQLI